MNIFRDLPNRLDVLFDGVFVVSLFEAVITVISANFRKERLIVVVVFGKLVGQIEETTDEELLQLFTVLVFLNFAKL